MPFSGRRSLVPPLVMLDEVDSTNAEAQRRAAAGERGPLWICARAQTQGRGRSGRSWGSPRGSLAASLLFCPNVPLARLPELALVAGVATADALAALLSRNLGANPMGSVPAGTPKSLLRIKWPNDILLDEAKVSGILIESTRYDHDQIAILGIGINIADTPVITDRAVTSLAEHGIITTPDDLAPRLAAAISRRLDQWSDGDGFAQIRAAWLERAGPLGSGIAVNAGHGSVSGTFAGLDTDGALLFQDGMGRRQRFTFGDVTPLRPTKA